MGPTGNILMHHVVFEYVRVHAQRYAWLGLERLTESMHDACQHSQRSLQVAGQGSDVSAVRAVTRTSFPFASCTWP